MSTESVRRMNVLVLVTNSVVSLEVVRCLGRVPGVRLHVASSMERPPARFSRYAASFRHLPSYSDDGALDALRSAVKAAGADVLMAADELTIRFLSVHRDALSQTTSIAHVPATEAFDRVVDKWRMAEFLDANGLRTPHTISLEPGEEFEAALDTMRFPVLIKPSRGNGGWGIRSFDSVQALRTFLAENPNLADPYIVQEMIAGEDIDCSILSRDGKILAHTIQQGFLPPAGPYAPPPAIRFLDDAPTFELTAAVIGLLNWDGVAHLDLRREAATGDVHVIEINPRYWGSLSGSIAEGVNFPYLACLTALGIEFEKPKFVGRRWVWQKSATLKAWARTALGRPSTRIGVGETALGMTLVDPMPELVSAFDRVRTKVVAAKPPARRNVERRPECASPRPPEPPIVALSRWASPDAPCGEISGPRRVHLVLDEGVPREEPDPLAWALWMETGDPHVDRTEIGFGCWVSTYLRADSAAGELATDDLFETRVFGGPLHGETRRYLTLGEAKAGHWEAVDLARKERALGARMRRLVGRSRRADSGYEPARARTISISGYGY